MTKPKSTHGKGRPFKLDPLVREKLMNAISVGMYLKPACAYAGISYASLRNWIVAAEAIELQLAKGVRTRSRLSKKERTLVDFLDQYRAKTGELEMRLVLEWNKHFTEDWRAIRDFMDRRFKEHWSPRSELELQTADEPLSIRLDGISPDQLRALAYEPDED